MTWIKASERLPEGDKYYYARLISTGTKFIWHPLDLKYMGSIVDIEWLDESEAQEGEKDNK